MAAARPCQSVTSGVPRLPSDAFGDLDSADPAVVLVMLGPYVPTSPWRLARLRRDAVNALRRGRAHSGAVQYARVMERLYSSIGRVAGARAHRGFLEIGGRRVHCSVNSVGVEVYLLHLLRDPRAVVYSWERNSRPGEVVASPGQAHADRSHGDARAVAPLAVQEQRDRARAGAAGSSHTDAVRGLCRRDPDESLERVCRFVQEASPTRPLVSREGVATVHDNHMAGGNRGRFLRGDVSIRPDDEWRSAISRRGVVSSTVFALPLARRYGYAVLGR